MADDRAGFEFAPAGDPDAHAMRMALADIPCPFAKGLTFDLWRAWRSPQPNSATFLHACTQTAHATSRAMVLELGECPGAIHDLSMVVEALADQIGEPGGHTLTSPEQWWFALGAEQYFTTVHARCYGPAHTRYWPLPNPVMVLIPRQAIERHLARDADGQVRRGVRRAFLAKGMRYPGHGGAIASAD